MRITIWGAGNIGTQSVMRLVGADFVSSLNWLNRSASHKLRAEDIRQGLAVTPSCRQISAGVQSDGAFAARALTEADVVVLTAGVPLSGKEFDRTMLYEKNCRAFLGDGDEASVCSLLRRYPPKFLLVVSNPVDLMTRFIFRECGLKDTAIAGLGTEPETARLRAALSRYCSLHGLDISPRALTSYAIGTHDKMFVPVFTDPCDDLPARDPLAWKAICRCAVESVRCAPEKVRLRSEAGTGESTLFTIVECIRSVVRALVLDTGDTFTVSVHDRRSRDNLFYSLRTVLDRTGVHKFGTLPTHSPEQDGLRQSLAGLRESIARFEPTSIDGPDQTGSGVDEIVEVAVTSTAAS